MFLESYIIPEIVAFYIANSFYREAMCEGSFEQFFNSALDIFNFNDVSFEKVKEEIVKLLKIKYAVKIIDEDPFILATTKRSQCTSCCFRIIQQDLLFLIHFLSLSIPYSYPYPQEGHRF